MERRNFMKFAAGLTPLLLSSNTSANRIERAELARYNSLAEEVIKYSGREKAASVVVDKLRHRLVVFNKGKMSLQYSVELGWDPINDKFYEGDGCTPEGIYHLTNRFTGGQTRFYKAFLIDYPSKQDRLEFKKLKAENKLPPHALTPGGLVEVHGHGSGKSPSDGGYDWTAGCIALSDSQMDELFAKGNIVYNTPIAIVRNTNII